MDLLANFSQFALLVVALVVTLTVHEVAHAATAFYLGDPTAKLRGRLTLNPFAHLDLFGSLMFLVTQQIGWGKPVPINAGNFRDPLRDSALVALAGPLVNFLFAFTLAIIWKYAGTYLAEPVLVLVQTLFHVNLFLGIFNLLPFPPLDGSKILGLFVPKDWRTAYVNFLENGVQYFVAIVVFDVVLLNGVFGFSFFGFLIGKMHQVLSALIFLGI